MYSRATGFVEGEALSQFRPGSQINVSLAGKENIQVGANCNSAAGQITEISNFQPEGKNGPICMKISEANFGTATPDTESSTYSQANPNGGGIDQSALLAQCAAASIVGIT